MTDLSAQQWDEMSTLDACILIEETCASIYYNFAGIFADSPKIFTLWTEMAIEEEKHADEFRQIKAIHCSNYDCSDIENELIKMMLEKLNSLNEGINSKTTSLREALLTALILEKSVEKYHLEASREILDPNLARLLDVMMEHSHGHIELLQLATDSIDTFS
jgi:rubrerythrin